jgi:glutamine synthetase
LSLPELVSLVTCDLGAIVRGRAIFASELKDHLGSGVGWVPANQALMPLGGLAEPNPFGSTGDLRLLPDTQTHVLVGAGPDELALELIVCDIVELDGDPWDCCPRRFLKDAIRALADEAGVSARASFEHEFQLRSEGPSAQAFSLRALREAEPFPTALMAALIDAGCEPERIFAEFAPHQFEIPVAPTETLASADRSVILREVVREVARREGHTATFVPLLDPADAGNGVHVHLSLHDERGRPLLHDATRPGRLSELGGSFAAGVLAHAAALSAICAPSPVSAERLRPHRWSAGAVCLGERNRETLLRIPPVLGIGGSDPEEQLHLEYRGADATANPYLALGALLRAGLAGIVQRLPAPAILEVDPAELGAEQAERFGVGALPQSLSESLRALEQDAQARSWMTPLLYAAFTSVKQAEVAATAELALEERCSRYAAAY